MDIQHNLNLKSEFLTGKQTADLLEISERTLYRWHRLRKGPPQIKIGRKVYYRADAVRKWLRDLEAVATSCN
jgi:predicted DNA-binding transcriptional regulator AlpA